MSSCCSCTQPQPSVCRTQITSADLAELLYIQGLDVNLCKKWAPIANIMQFRDCAGNIISANSQIVTCAAFAAQLCDTLATLASGGQVTLGVTQVVGADCQTYVIPETPLVAIDSTTIDFTTSGAFGHTLTGVVRVSIDAGNIIEVRPNGLYVPTPATACSQISAFPAGAPVVLGSTAVVGADCQTHVIPPTPPTTVGVADTTCINLNVSGAPGSQVISADPIVSPTAGNVLQCTGNGLYVGVCAHLASLPNTGPAVPGSTYLVGKDCQAYTLPVPPTETPITVVDTSCIDLSASGTGNHTLQANLIVSSAPGNIAQCTPFGLFVPNTSSDVNLAVVDTTCLNLTVTEAPVGTFTLSGNPVISPSPGNVLTCTGNGLFVPSAAQQGLDIVAVDTSCFNLTVTEAPAGVFTISGVPTISPAAGNLITCTAQGLYVGGTDVAVADTSCINMTLSGNTISAAPILATTASGFPAGCNGLHCDGSGMWVAPDHTGLSFEVGASAPVYAAAFANGQIFNFARVTLNITNPSNCRSMGLTISTRIPEVGHSNQDGSEARTLVVINQNFNFPSAGIVTGTILKTSWAVVSPAGTGLGSGNPANTIENVIVLPPGGSGTYFVEGYIEQVAGSLATLTVNGILLRATGNTF